MKLSVVIPTRGDQNIKNITACLRRQTFVDFETIFIIDKLLTSAECRMQSAECRNFRYINESDALHNASKLRNLGIKAAKGEFILLMDDDELFDDDYLERNVELREKYR